MKLFDSEWYFRKFIVFGNSWLPEGVVMKVRLFHDIKWIYKSKFGRKPSFSHPKTLNEKLIWLSLFWKHPNKSRCADKFKMRKYCIEKGLPEDVLVPLIGVYSSVEDVDISSLPEKFVLKCNHGCGYNIIVKDKTKFDIESAKVILNGWLSDYYHGGLTEFHYRDISPRLVMCESYLPSLDSNSIIDYKVHCINGLPVFVLVCYDRDNSGIPKLATFSFDWNQLYYCNAEEATLICRPKSLANMQEYSKIISKDFPFVRIDFYDVNGHPYIGELTFTPLGNMIDYFIDSVQIKYGKMLKLPPKYE